MLEASLLSNLYHGVRSVVVVDGDPTARAWLLRALTPLSVLPCGFSTAEAALAWLEANPAPHLISVDLMLPVMSGFALCTALRAHPRMREVPVVAVSSRRELHDEAQALEAGVDVFLPKPVSLPRFVDVARRLLNERPRTTGAAPISLHP